MFGYIYITENLVNGKRYIGKKSSPEQDMNYLGSGKLIKRAIKKYGKENFKCEVLEWCETEEELNNMEKYYIKAFNAQEDPMFYNISAGGDWGNITKGMTKEEYEQWKEKINPKGRHHSEETKKKMSEIRKGIIFSEETIEKMKINNAGEKNPHYGKKQTEKHKEAMKKLYKKTLVILPDKTELYFDSTKDCKNYMKENYNFSSYLVKKLLHDGTPLNLPESQKYIYPHVYKMNGTIIKHVEIKENIGDE